MTQQEAQCCRRPCLAFGHCCLCPGAPPLPCIDTVLPPPCCAAPAAHAAPAARAAKAQPLRMPIPDVPEPEVLNTIKLEDGISLIMGRADGFVLVSGLLD